MQPTAASRWCPSETPPTSLDLRPQNLNTKPRTGPGESTSYQKSVLFSLVVPSGLHRHVQQVAPRVRHLDTGRRLAGRVFMRDEQPLRLRETRRALLQRRDLPRPGSWRRHGVRDVAQLPSSLMKGISAVGRPGASTGNRPAPEVKDHDRDVLRLCLDRRLAPRSALRRAPHSSAPPGQSPAVRKSCEARPRSHGSPRRARE